MSTVLTSVVLSESQAKKVLGEIKTDLASAETLFKQGQTCYDRARANLWQMREYQGYKALGYKTWGEFADKEFKQGRNLIYKELAAAALENKLSVPIGTLPERVLRPLAKKAYTIEFQKMLYEIVTKVAGHPANVTSGMMESAIEALSEVLTTGTIQDSDGEQSPVFMRLTEDILARTTERIARHREHMQTGVNFWRGLEVAPMIEEKTLTITLDNTLTIEQMKAVQSGHLKLKISLWGNAV